MRTSLDRTDTDIEQSQAALFRSLPYFQLQVCGAVSR